jgi:hypothetical protein
MLWGLSGSERRIGHAAAISRYHANALTTVQVIEELIQLAKDIRAAPGERRTVSPTRKLRS